MKDYSILYSYRSDGNDSVYQKSENFKGSTVFDAINCLLDSYDGTRTRVIKISSICEIQKIYKLDANS